MVEILSIGLFLLLLVLSTLGARRTMLSRSANVILYAGFTGIAAVSAAMMFYGIMQGNADLMQGLFAVVTLQAAWLFMRGLSHVQRSARRESDPSYSPRDYSLAYQFEPVRV
ncbi:hypothetical protein [Actibacterium ureilyticum]|uniref:hypothetical protein n=1 Tax=Actibacterium ureilyticum TaxID=1590614 RepID=UPI000BAB1A57|nr:hypothetical protein [Actibacterium ureilyticum]